MKKMSKLMPPVLADITIPCQEVSVQATSNSEKKSHMKWSMTLGPQKGKSTTKANWATEWMMPRIQEAAKIKMHIRGFMMVR